MVQKTQDKTQVGSQVAKFLGITHKVFPIGKNELLVRIENRQDRFDPSSFTAQIDIKQFASALYFDTNGVPPNDVHIEEMNLSGTMTIAEMSHHKWMGIDGDGKILNTLLALNESENGKTAFEPMRVRTYQFVYS